MELCRFLRWKAFYGVEAFTPDSLRAHFERNEVPYSCLRTCQPWGPDDRESLPESCDSKRSCFEASERLIRPLS